MTREEIERAIENGGSVWYVDDFNKKIWEIDLNKKYKPEIYLDQILYVYQNINDRFKQELFIEKIYKTKAEAEHYLNHANISRTETLPLLTWEEFLEEKEIEFTDINGVLTWLYIVENNTPNIQLENRYEKLKMWDLTEANFYKAYDECVRLFKGGENE